MKEKLTDNGRRLALVECVRIYTGVAAKAKGQKKAEAVKELGEVKAELSGLTSRLQKKVLQAKRLKIFSRRGKRRCCSCRSKSTRRV